MSVSQTLPVDSSQISLDRNDRNDRNDPSYSTPTMPIPRSLSKSTPRALTVKPPPFRSRAKNQTEDDISVQSLSQPEDRIIEPSEDPFLIPASEPRKQWQCPQSHLETLPPEILEGIVGHVVGHLGSTTSDPSGTQHTVRNWNAIMRHPRRKKAADLALVSHTWRRLIQERVYRHIKIQGTTSALRQCADWFLKNHHLQGYVRHFEALVPIWEKKPGRFNEGLHGEQRAERNGLTFVRAFQGLAINPSSGGDLHQATSAFQLASKNATLEEIFRCAQLLFEGLCALTIEGGHCKHPPQVQYFRRARISPYKARYASVHSRTSSYESDFGTTNPSQPRSESQLPVSPCWSRSTETSPTLFSNTSPLDTTLRLPILPTTKTLILKGAWNMIRCHEDFKLLTPALPSLREFHCTYHKPKTMAYAAMDESLRVDFPPTITHINLCLEGLYTKTASSLKKWRKLYPYRHICRTLGAIAPQLESLTYTGRVCGCIFSAAVSAANETRQTCSRLRSIDIVVNNVCRDPHTHNDGTGIHNWPFIQAFEKLVLQGIRALHTYTGVRTMRIRFIDLDSPAPLLNPMFHLEENHAWGIYSDEILRALLEVRPNVHYGKLSGEAGYDSPLTIEDETSQTSQQHTGRYRCVSMDYYKMLANAGVLI